MVDDYTEREREERLRERERERERNVFSITSRSALQHRERRSIV
jgi:hypothetical protein